MYSGALRGGRWRRDKEEEGLGAGAGAGEGWFPKEEKPRGRAERGEELHCHTPGFPTFHGAEVEGRHPRLFKEVLSFVLSRAFSHRLVYRELWKRTVRSGSCFGAHAWSGWILRSPQGPHSEPPKIWGGPGYRKTSGVRW